MCESFLLCFHIATNRYLAKSCNGIMYVLLNILQVTLLYLNHIFFQPFITSFCFPINKWFLKWCDHLHVGEPLYLIVNICIPLPWTFILLILHCLMYSCTITIITQLSCKLTLMGNSDVYGAGGRSTFPSMHAVWINQASYCCLIQCCSVCFSFKLCFMWC